MWFFVVVEALLWQMITFFASTSYKDIEFDHIKDSY